MNDRRGRFLTLEGADGTGKSTQVVRLVAALQARGCRVLPTREPGGSPGAETLRHLLLQGGHDWAPLAETMLHSAARAEHVARTIRPALAQGIWVVSDRFFDSTEAYQGAAQHADPDAIAALRRLIDCEPDLTLILDLPETVARERRQTRPETSDRYERLDAAAHDRIAAAFRTIAAREPGRCRLIDASGSAENVHQRILDALVK